MNSFGYYRDRFILCGFAVASFAAISVWVSAWFLICALYFAFFAGYNIAYMTMIIDKATD